MDYKSISGVIFLERILMRLFNSAKWLNKILQNVNIYAKHVVDIRLVLYIRCLIQILPK